MREARGQLLFIIVACFFIVAATACSSIDCPMNNLVLSSYKLKGNVTKLPGRLTVATEPQPYQDTIVINSLENTDSFSLPMSYTHKEDIIFFYLTLSDGTEMVDTITLSKEDRPHFESVDCNPVIFHTLKGIRFTRNTLDSAVINNPNVTYNERKANIYLYFRDDLE